MNLLRKVTAIFDRTMDVFSVLAGVLLLVVMLLVSTDIVFRYFLVSPILGVDEISEIIMLYITFLGAAWLLRKEGHIRIDILSARLKPRTQMWLNVIASIAGVIVSLVLVWYGTLVTLDVWQRGIINPTILRPPRAAIFVIIPAGSLLLLLQFLRRVWSYRTGREPG